MKLNKIKPYLSGILELLEESTKIIIMILSVL